MVHLLNLHLFDDLHRSEERLALYFLLNFEYDSVQYGNRSRIAPSHIPFDRVRIRVDVIIFV